MSDTTKTVEAGAPFSIPLRCRFGWHRWTKWGTPVGLLGKTWNVVRGEYNE